MTTDSLARLRVNRWATEFLYVRAASPLSLTGVLTRATRWCCSAAEAFAAVSTRSAYFTGVRTAISEATAAIVAPASGRCNPFAEANTGVPGVDLTPLRSIRTAVSLEQAIFFAGARDVAHCNLRIAFALAGQFGRKWLTCTAQFTCIRAAVASVDASRVALTKRIWCLVEHTAFPFTAVECRRGDILAFTTHIARVVAAVSSVDASGRARTSRLRSPSALTLAAVGWFCGLTISARCAVVLTTVPDQDTSCITPASLG